MAPGGKRQKRIFIERGDIREHLYKENGSSRVLKNNTQENRTTTIENTFTHHPLESNLVAQNSANQDPKSPRLETPEVPPTEDVIATIAAGSKKRSRGQTVGKGLLKYFESNKTKIKINIDPSVGRPLNGDQSAKFASQIGVVTRDVLPVPKKWKEVDEKNGLEPGFDHLKMFMDVNVDDLGVRDSIIDRLKISSRNQRHRLHNHFQRYATLQEAKNNKPSTCHTKQQWEELCDYFASDKFKRASEVNKRNRSKLRCKHICGRKAFTVMSHEISQTELNGEECDRIELYKRTHSTDKDGWKSTDAKVNWEKMKKKRDEYNEQEMDKSSEEIALEVLGHGTGYIKGLGYGPKPPSKHNVSYATSNELQRKLHETQEKLDASETQVDELKTQVGDFKSQLLEQGAEVTTLKDQLNKVMSLLADKGVKL